MRLIKSQQIEEYVKNNKKEAESEIPYIIKKLLTNTVENLTGIDIPSGDNIVQIDFDGIVKFNGNNKYLGDKAIRIEIGTNEDYIKKANEDIEKRTPNENENFVFITPYRWNSRKKSKQKWIKEKKEIYHWNDIKIIDAEVLEDWLAEDIITSKYFLEKIGVQSEEIFSISEKELEYANKTTNKIKLDFFNYDDKEYEKLLLNMKKEYYNIVAPTREEGILVTLYYLKKIGREENTLIVESESAWKKIVSNNLTNNGILIPNFYHNDSLEIPSNNTTILIYDEEEFINSSDYTINQRTINNLNNALSIYYKNSDGSDDYDKIHSIINKSLGKYMPLKRELFKELNRPNWYKQDNASLYLYLLFINSFKSSDMNLFGNFGVDTKELKQILNKITKEKDPYIIYYKYWDNYRVVNIYNAIEWLGDAIDENDIEKLITVARKVLFYIEPKYLPQNINKKYYIEEVSAREYSEYVKNGIIKGLIVTKLYLEKENKIKMYKKLDDLIDEYYKSIISQSDFLSFANIADKLVELNYEKYLDKIKQSVNNNNFQKLFNLEGRDQIFSSNEYCKIIWGIEKSIHKKEYIGDAVETLALLCEMDNTEYQNMTNTPFNTLKLVFLGWDNLTCLSFDEKINLLKKLINNHTMIGKQLLKNIFPNDNCFWIALQKPEFDTYDEIIKIKYVREQMKYFNEYYILYLENYVEKLDDLIPIYEEEYFINLDCFELIKKKTLDLIKFSDDEEKFNLKTNISERLRGYRSFHNSAWDLNKKQLDYLTYIERNIQYKNTIYDYLYSYGYSNANDDELKKGQTEVLNLIKNNSFNENILLNKCNNKADIISDIYKYNHNRIHNINFILKLYKNYKDCIKYYLREIYINESIDDVIKIYNDKNLKCIPIEDKILILTEAGYNKKLYEEIKNTKYELLYWQNLNYVNGENSDFVYDCCLKYGNYKMCLDYIYKESDKYNEKCNLLEKIINSNYEIDGLDKYKINRIFEGFHSYTKRSDYEKLAQLEIYFNPILSKKSYFLSKEANKSPSIVAELVELIYKDDNGKSIETIHDAVVSNCFTILTNLKIDFENENGLQWCEEFLKIMKQKRRSNVMFHILGQLLARTDIDKDDKIFPSRNVRIIIEHYKSKELNKIIAIEKYNQRGVHSVGIGDEELKLSKMYLDWSNKIKFEYQETSKVLKILSDLYKQESKELRDEANYV